MRWRSLLLVTVAAAGLGIPAAAQVQFERLFQISGGSFLGVGIQEINADRAKELKLPEEAGVEITSVEANSPAATAGLKVGDVILQYNGQRLEGVDQFQRMVRETPVGREVKMLIFRSGASQTLTAKIGSRSGAFPNLQSRAPFVYPTNPPKVVFPGLESANTTLGVQVESLDGQLAEYFGVKEGVLVRSVTKGSPAERAGIKAGDVITKVGDRSISRPGDIGTQLRRNQNSSVTLIRDHRELTVNVNTANPNAGTAERF